MKCHLVLLQSFVTINLKELLVVCYGVLSHILYREDGE